MEELFTRASVAIELLSFGYVAGSFAYHTFWQPRKWMPSDPAIPEKKRKRFPVEELRQQCQRAGIKWRNAHGKNKHLKKDEMLQALAQLEQVRRPALSKPSISPQLNKAA